MRAVNRDGNPLCHHGKRRIGKERMTNEMVMPQIETERFLLRQIAHDDLDEWAHIKYSDPDVMR